MQVIVVENYEEMSAKAAQILASHITLKSNSVLGLATGSTVIGMYRELVKLAQQNKLDFKDITTFNLDEYYPIPAENEHSYSYYMHKNLFDLINMKQESIHIPNGSAEHVEEECKHYEAKILASGGIDIQVLGIGRNGHIGFNEPNVSFEARTHRVELDEKTIEDNARFFNSISEVPKQAISMGIKTIMHARKIMLLASGEEKSEAVFQMVYGKIKPELPASILQLHPEVVILLDKEAAKKLAFDGSGNLINPQNEC